MFEYLTQLRLSKKYVVEFKDSQSEGEYQVVTREQEIHRAHRGFMNTYCIGGISFINVLPYSTAISRVINQTYFVKQA